MNEFLLGILKSILVGMLWIAFAATLTYLLLNDLYPLGFWNWLKVVAVLVLVSTTAKLVSSK